MKWLSDHLPAILTVVAIGLVSASIAALVVYVKTNHWMKNDDKRNF